MEETIDYETICLIDSSQEREYLRLKEHLDYLHNEYQLYNDLTMLLQIQDICAELLLTQGIYEEELRDTRLDALGY